MRIYVFCILLIILPFTGTLHAQHISYQLFRNFTLSPEATVVTFFVQDEQGMMWIGSNRGLFSYDGYTTQARFTFGESSNTYIHCGVMVDNTRLYLGGENGLLIYNLYTDRYEPVPEGFPRDIRSLVLSGENLWIGSHQGLYRYTFSTGTVKYFDRATYPALPHEILYSLIVTTGQTLYIGTYDGCSRYSPEEDRFYPIPLPVSGYKSNRFVNSLLEDPARGCIWIGMEGELIRYMPETGQIHVMEQFHENSIKTLALDAAGNLLAGTDNGLYVYHEERPLQHIIHDSRNTSSLPNNIIWQLFTDRNQNVWLGTDYGFSFFAYNMDFQFIPITQLTGTGEGNHFYSLFRDSRGNFWFGGTNGLIRFRDRDTPPVRTEWYKMGDPQYPLTHNRIRHIYEDRDHHLWIATDGSIQRYDYDQRRFIHYTITDSTGQYNANWAYYLLEDTKGQLWIATCLGGVFVVDKQELLRSAGGIHIAKQNYTTGNGLSGMFVNQIISDTAGNIWLQLYNNTAGIDRIDAETGEVRTFALGEETGDKTPTYIIRDSEGRIWTGFQGGVLRIDPVDNSFRTIRFDNFSTNELLAMVEVEKSIWVSTTDGLWVVSTETLEYKRLPPTGRMFTSFWFDRSEEQVYMGSIDGFVISTPALEKKQTAGYPITINSLYINGTRENPLVNGQPASIRYCNRLTLRHTQNNLLFEVSDYPYTLQEKNKFIYRLQGLDKQWQMLNPNSNRISYNNLPAGSYELEVNKLDAYGNPASGPTRLAITITPAWYNSFWAKTTYYLLAFALIAWILNFFRIRNRLKIERIEKEKIMEQSRLKMDFFTHISHDLKTPLSLILAPVSRLLHENRKGEEKQQLETIRRNALRLNTLIHQVLDFNRVDNQADSCLILSKTDMVTFSRTIFNYFADAGRERDIRFEFYTNQPQVYVEIDVVKFESILTNVLSNALKYTPDGGMVQLRFRVDDASQEIRLAITDSGIGIPEQDLPYVFQRFYQSSQTARLKQGTGIGLSMVKSYTELHGGKVRIESEEQKGTTVTLTFPLGALSWTGEEKEILPAAQDPGRPLILIVEDNPEIASFLCSVLQDEYRYRKASNGEKGLEICLQEPPDLIITDLMMPEMNGLEMSRQIRKHLPTSTIPIILLTAKNDTGTELESIRVNIDAFISKPFEPEIVLSRVAQLLKNRQAVEVKTRIEAIATPEKPEAISQDEKFLSQITAVIEDHIDDTGLNVNALCDLYGVNNKQIYRKLKQLTGMTPVDYIKSIRMKKAAMLLQQKKFTVAEVMYMVGFSNHSYFSKCFQSEFGRTPRQYEQEL